MRLKSYFAGTVESAICLARQEMGDDALLVNSRKAQPEARHLGLYEVVFAASQEPAREAAPRSEPAQARKPEEAQSPAAQTVANEMAEMRRQLARMSGLVSRSLIRGGRAAPAAFNLSIEDLDQALTSQGVEDNLAGAILRNLEPSTTAAEVRAAFRKEITDRLHISAELSPWSFETAAGLGDPAASRAIVALVGPPGGGKTAI